MNNRIAKGLGLFLFFWTLVMPVSVLAQPTFSKAFSPANIGPGSVSTLTFTITNPDPDPVDSVAFTDTLPAGLTIADPALVVSDCEGEVSAPAGGATISLSDGKVGASASCTVAVDVKTAGDEVGSEVNTYTYTNTSGDLTSGAGNSEPAAADLTVAANRPGFSKSFSPSSVAIGARSALTFTIDNTANESDLTNVNFTDNLPVGLEIADPANVATDCTSGANATITIAAIPGSDSFSYSGSGFAITGFEVIAANSSCTVSVDVLATGSGSLGNSTSELVTNIGSSGKANATLEVTRDTLSITKRFTDDPVPPGADVTLEISITNFDRDESITNIEFSDDLDATLTGLAATGLPAADVCGAGSTLSGTDSLTLTGGSLAAGASCTFSATLTVPSTATPGEYPNTTDPITGNGGGITGNAATDILFVQPVPMLTKEFTDDPVGAGSDVTLQYTITNSSLTFAATNIEFNDELTTFLPFPVTAVLPPTPCGTGSTIVLGSLGIDGQGVSLTGGDLAISASCTFDIVVSIPEDLSTGTYTSTSEVITATVDGTTYTGNPATDTLDVVAGPTLRKSFTDDPVVAGGTVTLEFTLEHDAQAAGDATGITFTDDLAAALSGLTATGLPIIDVCDAGNGTITGSAGDTLLTFSGGSLSPGDTCTFSVTLATPAGAAIGDHTNTTSEISAAVNGVTVTSLAASDDLTIAGITFTKEFTDDPVIPGDTATLRFTLENVSAADATGILFTDSLSAALSGLAASALPAGEICGTGSSITGTNFLNFTGGNLLAGTSCTFDVSVDIPPGAVSDNYNNVTGNLSASFAGSTVVSDPATDALTVQSEWLQLTKEFDETFAPPGGTVELKFTVTNLHPDETASAITFTDDLNAALSGLVAAGLPQNDICGPGSSISGAGLLTFAGGELAAGGSCEFTVTVQIPVNAPTPTELTNTTSSISGTISALPVTGSPTADDLKIENITFTEAFNGPTFAGGTPVLTVTISNAGGTSPVLDLAFSNNLDATLSGLVATGLSINDVCGAGSVLSGTSLVTVTGGNLAAGASCSFNIPLSVPGSASAGSYANTTSNLSSNGIDIASAANDSLTIVDVAFTEVFNGPTFAGGAPVLTVSIDNTGGTSSFSNLAFTNNLAATLSGLVATGLPLTNLCGAGNGTLTGSAGDTMLEFSGGSLSAGASCTFDIPLSVPGSAAVGSYTNTTGNLSSNGIDIAPAASDALTIVDVAFSQSFNGPTFAGGTPVLSVTIDNTGGSSPFSNLAFSNDLDAALSGLVATGLPLNDVCGTGSVLSGTSVVTLSGGSLAAGGSCSFNIPLAVPGSAAVGSYTNTTGNLSSNGIDIAPAASDALTIVDVAFSQSFNGPTFAGGTPVLSVTIDNTGGSSPVPNLAFSNDLDAALSGLVATGLPLNDVCGTGSVLSGTSVVTLSGGSLAAGGSCSFNIPLAVPGSAAVGSYTNTTGNLSSNGIDIAPAASDALTIVDVAFSQSFNGPTFAGGTPVLSVTIDNAGGSSPFSNLAFSNDLDAALSGLVATGLPLNDVCGTGSVLSGTSVVTLSGGSLAAGGSCSFNIPLAVPGSAAVGSYTNTTGNLSSNGIDIAPAASDALTIVDVAFSQSFNGPTFAGGTPVLSVTIDNTGGSSPFSNLAFGNDLDAALSGLVATGLPLNDVCGTGSVLSGTSVVTLSGGSLAAGGSCSFNIPLAVPGSAAVGSYTNTTGNLSSNGIDIAPAASDALTIVDVAFSQSFNGPTFAGGTPVLSVTIDNTGGSSPVPNLAFSNDLDAALSGLVATGLPLNDVCGTGSVLSGTSVVTLSGGSLAAGGSCSFNIPLAVPGSAAAGSYANTTSSLTSDGTKIADAAGDDLRVVDVTFSEAFSGSSFAGGTPVLSVTIDNTGGSSPVSNLAFSNDLAATLAGLVATGLPLNDVCGTGSVLSGTSVVTLSGGNLAAGGSCSFNIPLAVPGSAAEGSYANTTSSLTSDGTKIADAAVATLAVIAPVTVNTTGLVDTRESDRNTTSFTVKLNTLPNGNVAIDVSSSDTSEGTVAPAGLLFTPSNWSMAQTVSVTGVDDLMEDGDQPYQVELDIDSASTTDASGYANISIGPVSLTNIDNDFPSVDSDGDGMPDGWEIFYGLNPNDDSDKTGDLDNDGFSNREEFNNNTDPTVADVSFTESFNGPTFAGGAPILTVTIGNAGGTSPVPDLAFTNDLAATLAGLIATGLPLNDVCGTGSVLSGTSLVTLTGGDLAAGESCTFDIPLSVPVAAAAGSYTNTTSDLTSDGSVIAAAADDELRIVDVTFSESFNGPSYAGGAPVLTVTIGNASGASSFSDLAFSNDLDATIAGLAATGLPLNDICGAGSVLSGTSLVELTGGVLAAGESCTIDIPLSVPISAPAGSYPNTTSNLSSGGIDIAAAAGATLEIIAPVTVDVTGLEDTRESDRNTTSFTVQLNTAPNGDVVIDLNSSDVSEGTVAPASLLFTPSNWSTVQTVFTTGVDDLLEDGDQPYQVELAIDPTNTTDTSGYANISIDAVSVTNIDNDFPTLDSDGDGIPDGWEVYFGLDPDDPSDAAGDLDNDGESNLLEFIKNTDPTASDNFFVSHIIFSGSGFLLNVISPDSATFAMFRVSPGGGEEEITPADYSGSGTAEDPFAYQWTTGRPYTSMATDTPNTGDTTYTVTFHFYANNSELPFVYTVTYKEYASDANREADIPADLLEIETFYGQTPTVVVYTQHVFDPSQSDEFTLVIQDPANPGEYEAVTITMPANMPAYLFIDDSGNGDGGNLNYDSQTDFYDIDTGSPGYQAFNPADFILIKAAYYDFEDPVVADGLSIGLEVASGAYQGSVVKYNPIQKPDGSGRDPLAPAIELSLYLNPEAEAYDKLNQISDAQGLVSFMMNEKGDGVDGFAPADLSFTVYDDGFVIFDINHLTTFGVAVEDQTSDGNGNDDGGLCFISAVATEFPFWWILGFAVALIALAAKSLDRRKTLHN